MTSSPTESFPHQQLTAIPQGDKPNYVNLKELKQQLNANAMAIPSTRGGGQHGMLALVIPPTTYDALANTQPWVNAVHPGIEPIHANAATAAQITETNRKYKQDLQEFMLISTVAAHLKKLLIEAVPDTFLKAKRDHLFGYANVTVLQLLTHLDLTYGTITATDLDLNEANMEKEWSPTQPLEDLWNQIELCQAFAKDHDPISEKAAIRSACANLTKTGVFAEGLKEWRKTATADQTWQNLVIHFNKEDKERLLNVTAKQAGYAGAAKTGSPKSTNSPPSNIPMYYCWSHGLTPNNTHNSKTCTSRQPGHRDEATVDNMLGGCCVIGGDSHIV